MRNWKKAFGVTVAVAMAAAAVMPTTVFAEEEETFKIGVIGPMTGDYAQYGGESQSRLGFQWAFLTLFVV